MKKILINLTIFAMMFALVSCDGYQSTDFLAVVETSDGVTKYEVIYPARYQSQKVTMQKSFISDINRDCELLNIGINSNGVNKLPERAEIRFYRKEGNGSCTLYLLKNADFNCVETPLSDEDMQYVRDHYDYICTISEEKSFESMMVDL